MKNCRKLHNKNSFFTNNNLLEIPFFSEILIFIMQQKRNGKKKIFLMTKLKFLRNFKGKKYLS
jgi:hypothetical protein